MEISLTTSVLSNAINALRTDQTLSVSGYLKREVVTRIIAASTSIFKLLDALANLGQCSVELVICGLKKAGINRFSSQKHSWQVVKESFNAFVKNASGILPGTPCAIWDPGILEEDLLSKEANDTIFERLNPKAAAALYKIMQAEAEVFKKFGIRWWINGGTLLGEVRHKGVEPPFEGSIVPWDDDADSQVHPDDQYKLKWPEVQLEFKKYGLQLTTHWLGYKIFSIEPLPYGKNFSFRAITTKTFQLPFGKKFSFRTISSKTFHWPDVDIYTSQRRKKDGAITYTGIAKIIFPNEIFTDEELFGKEGKLRETKFGPITVFAPQHPEGYCDRTYGKDWRDVAYRIWNHQTEIGYNRRQKVKIVTRTPVEYDQDEFKRLFNKTTD